MINGDVKILPFELDAPGRALKLARPPYPVRFDPFTDPRLNGHFLDFSRRGFGLHRVEHLALAAAVAVIADGLAAERAGEMI